MSLTELTAEIDAILDQLDDEYAVTLDGQTRRELALLVAVYEPDTVDDIVRRAIHQFTQSAVDRGSIDQQLRTRFDLTYDEYLAGMTYEEMGGTQAPSAGEEDDRRYRF